ncbi:uncharacterized protein LOC130507514, partial [Raphanus sativus]|uniref:Uncharacterized protein LOC130507514 n=1 Tax=Raphanus sativus TaxID=3726 RepID=A0A9W3D3D1_RAPSA
MVQETVEQVEMLKTRLKEAHDHQKSYADKRRKDLEFQVGDLVYLKMRTFRGGSKTRKLKKLKPRYMGPKVVREPELILPQPPKDLGKNLSAPCLPVEIMERQVKAVQEIEPSLRLVTNPPPSPVPEPRSDTTPPSHAEDHHRVRDVERSPELENQPENRRDAPPSAERSFAREDHAPPPPPDVRRSRRSRPPSVRRRESAAPPPPPVIFP